MNLFEVEPLLTTTVGLYKNNETLQFVPTTERGSPRVLPGRDTSKMIQLPTVNLRQEDRINSAEMLNVMNNHMPFEVALLRADDEVDKRQRKLMRKLEYTREYHRLAALQGILLDADGSVIINYFTEFEITQPAAIVFDFATLDEGELREYITTMVYRPMMRVLRDRKGPGTYIAAYCGDEFFDKMLKNPEIRDSYRMQQAGAEMREQRAWQSLNFAGVVWMNFMGTDDSAISIPTNQCKFFPVGAIDVFKEYRAPGEEWRAMEAAGLEFYAYVIPDPRAPNYMAFVDLFLDAHPLFACIAPETLLRGILAA
jgi:hypothetical protein